VTVESKIEIINPPNTLKSKIVVGGPGAVDPNTLERAEAVIAGMSDNYLKSVQDDMVRISSAFERLKNVAGDGSTQAIEEIFQISHDVKGQGGSFGYPLLTAIGNELCRLIEKMGNDIGSFARLKNVDSDHLHALILVPLPELLQMRSLHIAPSSPTGEEIQDDHLALEIR